MTETAVRRARPDGHDAVAGCQFLRVDIDAGEDSSEFRVVESVGPAWQYWTRSDAREPMPGLALDDDVTWAVAELTRPKLAAGEPIALVGERTRGATVRLRTRHAEYRGTEVADYAAVAWDDGIAPSLPSASGCSPSQRFR